MTEREKMTSEEWFDTRNDELMQDKAHAREVAEEFNQSKEHNTEYRASIIKKLFGTCGDNPFIKPPFHCDYGYNINIGNNFFANFNCCFLDAAPIFIGDNCLIGPNTCIFAINHPIEPEKRKTGIAKGTAVHIGNNVWLGGNCTILPGVTIGDNTVVGAGSVVTHDLPNNVEAAGNPARIIKNIC